MADADPQAQSPDAGQRPLELLDVLDVSEVVTGPGTRHTEILTRTGKLGLLWDGDPTPQDKRAQDGRGGRVLVACSGAFGGLLGPAGGLYHDLARRLAGEGVCTVRVDYRQPGQLQPCILDAAVAVDLAERVGGERFILVGHSFGGAVAVSAGASLPDHVVAVVTLATQSAGCQPAAGLRDRPFLLVHGDADTIIPASSSAMVRGIAGHGEVVVLPGSGHLLREHADELRERLHRWLLAAYDGEPGPF
jgi:pimeloyl-ACP methyl ester carboxylesterase